MDQLMQMLTSASNLLLVVLGFSLIIVFHELGHFLAARWAGIRVLAFAVGFGPAICSYRKGLGWRRGSSEVEYKMLQDADAPDAASGAARSSAVSGVSATEYRLNALPFGGYVKMLGQDDADPTARSSEPDGYQQCKVWKRMIVISAGVVMNVLLAAILFVVVFMIGLKVEPARIGYVSPASPAALAVATNAEELKVSTPGLQSGDLVTRVNGKRAANFNDLMIASAMARPGRKMSLEVERQGFAKPLLFEIEPSEDPTSRMLQLGIGPASSATLLSVNDPDAAVKFKKRLADAGLVGVEPGSKLVRVGDDNDVQSVYELVSAAERSGGKPIPVNFALYSSKGELVTKMPPAQVQPVRAMQTAYFRTGSGRPVAPTSHVLGLMPVMRLDQVNENGKASGLQNGDIFAQIGNVEWPSLPAGIAEIRASKGNTIRIVVVRTDATGDEREVTLDAVKVSTDGTIGFLADDTARFSTRIAAWPSNLAASVESIAGKKSDGDASARVPDPASVSLKLLRGTRISAVAGKPVANFNELIIALIDATRSAPATEAGGADVELTAVLPLVGAAATSTTVRWNIPASDVQALQALGWESPISPDWFARETFVQKASNPLEAVSMGLAQTRTVMLSTYVTFVRLFQGSVKVEHLKGPVGIAHVGTVVASKGPVWLMFFMALISVNLAVVNFLPLPIVDGGHFLFLLYEQITGKPVSVAIQNITALAGLALVIGMFILVTFNDISNLFR